MTADGFSDHLVVLEVRDERDDFKMLRETLAQAQSLVDRHYPGTEPEAQLHSERIGRLIAEIDRQRPLGTNGKHGDLHTPTCGCEAR